MNDIADFYKLEGTRAELLLPISGIFVLSNGDGAEVVITDIKMALKQRGYQYVDAFPKDGGSCAVSVKLINQNGTANVWSSDF